MTARPLRWEEEGPRRMDEGGDRGRWRAGDHTSRRLPDDRVPPSLPHRSSAPTGEREWTIVSFPSPFAFSVGGW